MSSASPPHLDDETLSGLLDGEPAPAGDHLAGCAACRARQAQLAESRILIASPIEALDEVTRRRLIGTAVSTAVSTAAGTAAGTAIAAGSFAAPARQARWYRRPAVIGGVAAAAAAVLLAVPVITSFNDDGSDDASTAAPALSAEAAGEGDGSALPTALGDLGEVTASAVRERLGATGTGADTMADSAEMAPTAPQAAAGTAREERAAAPPDVNAYDSRVGGAAPCVNSVMAESAQGAQLRAIATGTLGGTPVSVVIVDRDGTTLAYVAARDGCRLLETYTL